MQVSSVTTCGQNRNPPFVSPYVKILTDLNLKAVNDFGEGQRGGEGGAEFDAGGGGVGDGEGDA